MRFIDKKVMETVNFLKTIGTAPVLGKLKDTLLPERHRDALLGKVLLIKFLLKYRTTDFFNDINIETNTSCNRFCKHCPNSKFDRGRLENEKLMEEELFKKIIDELAGLKWSGRISPHWYGEPLLDKRIVDLMRYAREMLPVARLLIFSNGDYLTVDLYNKLVDAGINKFFITQHGRNMSPVMKELFAYLEENPRRRIPLYYQIIDQTSSLENRGGLIEPKVVEYNPRCGFPDNPLVIDFDGNVVLCCNDYLGSVKFGNLREKTLIEIWNSNRYTHIREQLRKKTYTLSTCKRCTGSENKF